VQPFDAYPGGGRVLLGRLVFGDGTCRTGYGLSLQRKTGQTACAYCGVDLTSDYYRWLLLSVDHVVPAGEARRLGVPLALYDDAINLVVACSGCNGFLNRYRCADERRDVWSLDDFLELRNRVFGHRYGLVAARRAREIAAFERRPWATSPVGGTANGV
jgi:hypothetical protein